MRNRVFCANEAIHTLSSSSPGLRALQMGYTHHTISSRSTGAEMQQVDGAVSLTDTRGRAAMGGFTVLTDLQSSI
jgi:hypothetical protein